MITTKVYDKNNSEISHNILGAEEESLLIVLQREPVTVEQLCSLPLKKVWFQWGLWLGVGPRYLRHSCLCYSELNESFDFLVRKVIDCDSFHLPLDEVYKILPNLTRDPTLGKTSRYMSMYTLNAYLDELDSVQQEATREQLKLQKDKMIVIALIKVGLCKEVEKLKG